MRKTITRTMLGVAIAGLAAACGGEENPSPNDDAGTNPPVDSGTEVDASTPPVTSYPVTNVVPFSANGPDQLQGVAWEADGSGFFASGHADESTTSGGDRVVVVARFHANGELDTAWGNGGSVRIDVSGLGGRGVESGRSIVLQTTGANAGKILVGGVVEHDVQATGALANDADAYVMRLHHDGRPDMGFGANGIRRLDFNEGVVNAAGTGVTGADTLWNIALFADDSILVHGSQRADGVWDADADPLTPDVPRTDNDWVALKLTPDGAIDTTWAATSTTPGRFVFDAGYRESAGARTGVVLAGGGVLGGGYATPSGAPQRPILFRLTPQGELDPTFGHGGVFDQTDLLSQAAEAYGAAVQGTSYVTAGYGRDTGDTRPRWLSFRITADGQVDDTYGEMGTVFGRFKSDVFGNGGNARSLVVLPSGEILLVGGAGVSITPTTLPDGGVGPDTQTDAVVARLGVDGDLVTGFGTGGFADFDLGGPNDFLWASESSVSPASTGTCSRRVALVGVRGYGATQSAALNDESAVVVLCEP